MGNGSLTDGMGCVDWIDLAQNRDRWHTLMNALLVLVSSSYLGNFVTTSGPVSF